MQSAENKIEKSIKRKPRGTLVLPEDFLVYGSAEVVRQALSRLRGNEMIAQVAHGIYVCPKVSKLI